MRCQALEDRATPATFTVNTLADSTGGPNFSLRDAIHAANNATPAPHLITFDLNAMGVAGPLHGKIALQTALPAINKSLTIDGLALIDVQRGPFLGGGMEEEPPPPPKFRIFEINAGVTATFEDLSIFYGDVEGDGGGILNNGTAILEHTIVAYNTASGKGGGVMNNGILSLSNVSKIRDNVAGTDGGGIMNTDALAMVGSFVMDNTAGGAGGGGRTTGAANLSLVDSFLQDNTSVGFGGGMAVGGSFQVMATISECHISGNRTTGTGSDGGGLFLDQADVTITGGSISGNTSARDGGGLYADDKAFLSVDDVTFSGNNAGRHGGGMALYPSLLQTIHVDDCLFVLNESTNAVAGLGGGIYITGQSGNLILVNSTFDRNTAVFGGGLYAERPTDIYGGLFVGNVGTAKGGGMYGGDFDVTFFLYLGVPTEFRDNYAPQGDGILWTAGGGTLTLGATTFVNDTVHYI